ncbi:protein mcm10 [Echinococcus multilocularis]|uniref:Protein MCM10 homolog n=1 Tax=Echinococcus multilocularis TaxID=6211 RepID=A0A068Y8K0_ECHMU|nr:protein mcm10 [Echinococcus multilocularis]
MYFALHISHHDIPLHIYRMRSMGYPPGWLRKAKVEQLPFFDGEHEVGSGLEVKYNEDAIIAYPGFNVCSSKLRDEYFTLQCPSIQRRHLLKNFIFSLRNSSTNILEFSRYKESLESKDLNDLKGERQRLLSEINALENSLPLTSNHSELLNKCKELSKTRLDPSESTFLREASGSPRASLADQIFPLNAESASVDDADREGEMRGIATTAEAGFYGEVTQWSAVGESAKEQLELESEEGTAIPSSIAHLVANTSSNSGSGSSPLNISCAQKKLPELEAFSSGIQPFKPYKNLPNAQGAYNRVRNTLKRAKGNPTTLVRSETQNKPTRKLPMSEDPAPRSGLCEGRHGCRPAISMDSRLNSSSGVENRLQRSNKEKIDNQACEMDKLRYRRRHLRQDNLCILEKKDPFVVDIRGVPIVPRGTILVIMRGTIVIIEPVNPPSKAPQSGAKVQPERTQSVPAPMAAEDINKFLAHPDGESSDNSDWSDVKEEDEEEAESCGMRTAALNAVSTPSPIPQPTRDVGVAELIGPARTNMELTNLQSANTENESIFDHTGAWRSGLSEYGLQIRDSLSKIASEKHETHIEREVHRIVCASEQVANIGSRDSLTDSQRNALQISEFKRVNALASLGNSRMGSPSFSSLSKDGGYFVAVPTNIRVIRSQISSELWAARTSNRRVFSLSQYVREAVRSSGSSLQTEATVLVGVIGSKTPPHRSRNNKIFSIWRLTDLMKVGTGAPNGQNISLFLFGAVHEKLWKEPEGTVVAILKPKLLPSSENGNLTSTNAAGLSITVDSAPFVMLLGMSFDFALCAATTKVGRPCSRIVNKNICRYCDLHVKAAYHSASSMRPGFATALISKPSCSQRRGLKKLFGIPSALAQSSSAFVPHRPASMRVDRSQDSRVHSRPAVHPIDQSPSALSTASKASLQSAPSELEVPFASTLTRPTRGSLNLLRYFETASASHLTVPPPSAKDKYLKNATPQAKLYETFSTFFAGVKNKTLAQKPQIGRELEVGASDDYFVDLGPVLAQDSELNTTLTVLPSRDAARRRSEALVQTRGGIDALHQSARERTQKRILDIVSQPTSKKTKPSPLTRILGPVSSSEMNTNSKQEGCERTQKASGTWKSGKREELARLVSQGSRHADIAAANETSAEWKLLSCLEARDRIEEKLLNQHEQECQVVTCLRCRYRSLHASQTCRKEGHKLRFSIGVRRFFACRNCKTRMITLDRYPNFACTKCGESLFEKAGAIAERKGPKLAGEKLLIRGIEEKYLS